MTYGTSREEAITKVEALALRVLADRLDHTPEIHQKSCLLLGSLRFRIPEMEKNMQSCGLESQIQIKTLQYCDSEPRCWVKKIRSRGKN